MNADTNGHTKCGTASAGDLLLMGGEGVGAKRGLANSSFIHSGKIFDIAIQDFASGPKKEGGAGGPATTTQHTAMSKPRLSQCGLTSTIDCMEDGCPGVAGIRPETWDRPLLEMAQAVQRYEDLLLEVGAWLDDKDASLETFAEFARRLTEAAAQIKKKRGVA